MKPTSLAFAALLPLLVVSFPSLLSAEKCSDGVTTCPDDYECRTDLNPAGEQSTQCVKPGSIRCDFGNGFVSYCAADQVCDVRSRGCGSARDVVPRGEFLCPDGLNTCPVETECKVDPDPAGQLRVQCIKPAYTKRCDHGGGFVDYCLPHQLCDVVHRRCMNPEEVPKGQFMCPDGRLTCPVGMECKTDLNPANELSTQCVKPGSKRCDFGNGFVAYCAGDLVCDARSRGCGSARDVVPRGEFLCPDGLNTCPVETECKVDPDPAGQLRVQCIKPAYTKRCDHGGGFVDYCLPHQLCDVVHRRCMDPEEVPKGQFMCPDGRLTCPVGMECKTDLNPANEPSTQCVKPGSKRCDFGNGFVAYCAADQVCEAASRGCAEGPPPPGALVGKPEIAPLKREDHGEGRYTLSTYTARSAEWDRFDPTSGFRLTIRWDYDGVPNNLTPGQTVVITVTGGIVAESPKDAGSGNVLAGVVAVYGDIDMKSAQQADRGNPTGRYEFVVRPNARAVEIHLGGSPAGTGAIWKYAPP